MKLCPQCKHCYEDSEQFCDEDHVRTPPPLEKPREGSILIAEKYRLIKLLSKGGMGAVYLARHLDLGRSVAIKLIRPEFIGNDETLRRFKREARAVSQIGHVNVVQLYDFGTNLVIVQDDKGVRRLEELFIVMELLKGQTLRQYLDSTGRLPYHFAAGITRQIASGIEASHQTGIIHRDLKPSNIFVLQNNEGVVTGGVDDGEIPQVKVIDFGIAKHVRPVGDEDSIFTDPGLVVGTPSYMSPEQCGGGHLDERSDVYSLGIILFEMLAGQKPFTGPELEMYHKHLRETPPSLKGLRPDAPDRLVELVAGMLEKEPFKRPQSGREVAQALRDFEREVLFSSDAPTRPSAKEKAKEEPTPTTRELETPVQIPPRRSVAEDTEINRIAAKLESELEPQPAQSNFPHNPENDPRWSRLRQAYDSGSPVRGSISGLNERGLTVNIDGITAILPISQLGTEAKHQAADLIGREIEAKISNLVVTKNPLLSEVLLSSEALLEGEKRSHVSPAAEPPAHEEPPRTNSQESEGDFSGAPAEPVSHSVTRATEHAGKASGGDRVIKGKVVQTTGDGVLVNFGFMERLISWDKFVPENYKTVVAPSRGQMVEAVVTGTDSPEGFTFLSYFRTLPHAPAPETPSPNKPPPRVPPNRPAKATSDVGGHRIMTMAGLTAVLVVAIMLLAVFLSGRWGGGQSQASTDLQVASGSTTSVDIQCPIGSRCIATKNSHLRNAAGKNDDQGQENKSLGIATKDSLVEVLDVSPVRTNWRKVRIIKHGGAKNPEWGEEGWMDGGNLRPVSNP